MTILHFLLLKLIMADQVADLPTVESSNGQVWQFEISTARAHICRLSDRTTGRSTPR